MAALELCNVTVSFGEHAVLRDVSLSVADGEFVVLVGPSGCGKSTLLRVVAGLVRPASGEVRIGDRRVDALEPAERDLAMVFQNYALYPHKTVAQNLAFPLELRRVPRAELERRVRETAESLGLADLLERKPGALSGGQMQRVALGRALIRDPKLFLFDEPLSNLDAKLRHEMRAEIARLHQRTRVTSLYVTHDQSEALTLGGRIAVLDRGRFEQIGAPLDVFARPATRFVAGFIGSPAMNLLPGVARGGRFEVGELSLAAPTDATRELVLGVRPHEVALDAARARDVSLELEVTFVEALGTQTLVSFRLGEHELRASLDGDARVRVGERKRISISRSSLHWFDQGTGLRLD
ncbi:MAG: sn-glycerol-3-phosphate ABC transporter ATP-binding protein UgpC [Planctomycetes bacterium]|nr:sn-glycerol-3-phosphate ABC transporter ATP-binding protein UgpC [Planctomycetota bacterium]